MTLKTMTKILALGLFLKTLSAQVVEIEIEEKTQKPLNLSEERLNRIAVVDGSISSIIASPNIFNIKIDENLGQAFVTLKQPVKGIEGMTVVTDSGYTQDFLVTSGDEEPLSVYLNEPFEEGESFQSSLATIQTLSDIFDKKSPEGFLKRPFGKDEIFEVGGLLQYVQSIDIFEGSLEDIFVLNLRNLNKKSVQIEKSAFGADKFNWIFCPPCELKKGEHTTIAISKRKV